MRHCRLASETMPGAKMVGTGGTADSRTAAPDVGRLRAASGAGAQARMAVAPARAHIDRIIGAGLARHRGRGVNRVMGGTPGAGDRPMTSLRKAVVDSGAAGTAARVPRAELRRDEVANRVT